MSWVKECIISETSITPRIPPNTDDNPPVQEEAARKTTSATFQINKAKLYVLVVTLSINDNFQKIKQRFKRIISLNKYRSRIKTRSKRINLDCLIDLLFRNTNRLIVLSFKNGNDDPTRTYFDKY